MRVLVRFVSCVRHYGELALVEGSSGELVSSRGGSAW